MKKVFTQILFLLATSIIVHAQVVNIPDANFKAALVGNTAINTNADNEIQLSEAQAYNGSIFIPNKSIGDLTGISAFVNINNLNCYNNNLTSLDLSANIKLIGIACGKNNLNSIDLSQNTALVSLSLDNNQLKTLDISNNSVLKSLHCSENQLTTINGLQTSSVETLDCYQNDLVQLSLPSSLKELSASENLLTSLNVTTCPNLISLNCNDNKLSTLDASQNPSLDRLFLHTNQLTALDVSNNLVLKYLDCGNNQLTELDVTKNTDLVTIDCYQNKISELNITKNTTLERIQCWDNEFTNLDFGQNTALIQLGCSSNPLVSLNLQNGNNTNIIGLDLPINGQLKCIQVDDVSYANANFSKPAEASFSTNCPALPVDITISKSTIQENNQIQATVGQFATVQSKLDHTPSYIYSLVSGQGSSDNGAFTIESDQLRAAFVFDYEVKDSYFIRVKTEDTNGYSIEKNFTISISEGPDAILGIDHSESKLSLSPNPTSGQLTLSGSEGKIKASLFQIDGNLIEEFDTPIFDISHLDASIYILKILDNYDQVHNFKVIKN